MDFNVEYGMIRGQPVDVARCQFGQNAVDKKAKYLFFIDEDVTPPGHAIRQLIYHLEHFPKAAVAAGIYCHKSEPPFPMVFRGNGAGSYWDWKIGEVFDCSGIGMGCALIRVAALETIEKPWFKTIDNAEAFKDGINSGEAWTEDLYFCDKLTKAGWQIMADGGILPDHWDAKTHRAYNLPTHSKPMRAAKMEPGSKKVVDLGCGRPEESYMTEEGVTLRVDIRDDVQPDYRCDLRQMPFATGEFDVVFSGHTLEHFLRQEVPTVLDEWVRILKPDGELRLNLPNLEWAAQHILNKEIDDMVMNVLYGAQTYEENFHKCGFTPQIIEQLLAERGFKKFSWSFNNYHMFVRAWKVAPEVETNLCAVQQPNGLLVDRLIPVEKPKEEREEVPVKEVAREAAVIVTESATGAITISPERLEIKNLTTSADDVSAQLHEVQGRRKE